MRCIYLLSFSILFFLLTSLFDSAWAQLDSCNVFLKGNYVEVGINWNGAYGSSAPAPAGYHPKGSASVINAAACDTTCVAFDTNLGFVADPDHNGWTVGTPPYYGDYFLPGSPQEGWSIMADGIQGNAWNEAGCAKPQKIMDSTITGQNITYYDSGDHKTGVWQGMFDSIQITQITRLDTGADYFTMLVKLKNTGVVTRHDIYYLRTVDPDNDEAEPGGSFNTINKIEYQLPNPANRVLVTARGTSAGHPLLALGTHDTTAKCFIIKKHLDPSFQNLDSMYNGMGGAGDTTDYLYHDSLVDDVGIGLVIKINDLKASDSTYISLAYVFSKPGIDSAYNDSTLNLLSDTSGNNGTYIANVKGRGRNIHVYPNPFRNEITISGLTGSCRISICDVMGRKINGDYTIKQNAGNQVIRMGDNVPNGVYILQVMDDRDNLIANKLIEKY